MKNIALPVFLLLAAAFLVTACQQQTYSPNYAPYHREERQYGG
jgi:hypothetical protein